MKTADPAPADPRLAFYRDCVAAWLPDRAASILVVAGAENDRDVFAGLGFTAVTISNLDERHRADGFAPYPWRREDAENLSLPDDSVDYCVVHAALHHCGSPHRAMLEMWRVARRGILCIEARDSALMRLLVRLGLTQTYETTAVYYNDCRWGGWRNTEIPNHVYRWTEREIAKTLATWAPWAPPRLRFRHGTDAPRTAEQLRGAGFRRLLVRAALPLQRALAAVFPRQQNLLAWFAEKPDPARDHFPWLRWEDGRLRFHRAWAEARLEPKLKRS